MPKKQTTKPLMDGSDDSERRAIAAVTQIIDLLIDMDAVHRQRVIASVQSFFPTHVTVKPSRNGVEAMP